MHSKSSYFVCFDVSVPFDETNENVSVVLCSDLRVVIFCHEDEIEKTICEMFPRFEVFIKDVEIYNRYNS